MLSFFKKPEQPTQPIVVEQPIDANTSHFRQLKQEVIYVAGQLADDSETAFRLETILRNNGAVAKADQAKEKGELLKAYRQKLLSCLRD